MSNTGGPTHFTVPVVEVDTARVEQRQEQREVRHCDIGQADDRVLVPHPVAGGTVTGPGLLQQPLQERAHAAQDEAVDGDAAVAADDGAVAVTVTAMETGHAWKRERRGGNTGYDHVSYRVTQKRPLFIRKEKL